MEVKMKKIKALSGVLTFAFLSLLCSAAQAQEYRFERAIGRPPAVADPQGLAVDNRGNLYVADRMNAQVIRITPAGATQMNVVKEKGLQRPVAVAVDVRGNLIVVDEGRSAAVNKAQATIW